MKLLVALAICAVCVSGEEKASESLKRHKRGWGYETTTQGWTTTKGWTTQGWTTPPPPPPPTKGWGWPEPTTQGWGWQPPTTQGWGWQPPSNGWGSSSGGGGGSIYQNYPIRGGYSYTRPSPYRGSGGSRYGRDTPYRNRYYRDTLSSVHKPSLI